MTDMYDTYCHLSGSCDDNLIGSKWRNFALNWLAVNV